MEGAHPRSPSSTIIPGRTGVWKSGKPEERREQQETQPAWMIDLVFRNTHKNITAAGLFDPVRSDYDVDAPSKTRIIEGF